MPSPTKKIKIHGDRIIWLLVGAFAMISLLVLYSSTSSLAFRNDTTPFELTLKQFISFVVGFGGMFVCYLIPLRWWRKMAYVLLVFSAFMLMIALLSKDHRHIFLGPISVQPSELAKISVVLYLGRILEISKMDTFKEYALRILLPLGLICSLTFLGSISATLIILTVSTVILACSAIRKKYIIYTVLIVFLAGGTAIGTFILSKGKISLSPRIETFLNRVERHFTDEDDSLMTEQEKQDYAAKTEQSLHSRQAIQMGGILGKGPGNGLKKYILPNAYDDYVFSSIVEEYGLIGAILIMTLYITFFFRCLLIAQACKKTFPIVATLGLGFLIVLQAFLHIFVNTGILPVTGQTLPLISNGGTSIVILSCAVGVILSINRTIELTVEKEKITASQVEEQRLIEEERIRQEIKKLN